MFSEVSWDTTLISPCLAEAWAKELEKTEWHHKTNSNSDQDRQK